jgi:CDP-paratose 2-epimerase
VIGHPVETIYSDWRAGDQRYYVSDTRLVMRELGLKQPTSWLRGVAALASWLQAERGHEPLQPAPRLQAAGALP